MKGGAGWFEVDRRGLAKLLQRRGKSFIVSELLQNAWDEDGVTTVTMELARIPGVRQVRIAVEDDAPDGFADLAHAYTIFAESRKKHDATKRGRFNLGEKLILALAVEARISSTKGGWAFDADGRRQLRKRRERGSQIELVMPMTQDDVAECDALVRRLLPPAGIATTYNGLALQARVPTFTTEEIVATEIADADGNLRQSRRKARIDLIRVEDGGEGWLYEMGIPVVATGDAYHVDVHQKVPLNMERDNVPPGYLRALRTIALNLAHAEITQESANATWAREALADPDVTNEAVASAFKARFGEKAVTFDPTDQEANKRAVSDGYVVVHGSQLNSAEWKNVRRANVVLPAGRVTPSPKAYDPNGRPARAVPEEDWTPSMKGLAAITRAIAVTCARVPGIDVIYEVAPTQPYGANYGVRRMTFNLGRLGKRWPDAGPSEEVLSLILHELGHEFSGDHLSREYYDALTMLGARLGLAAAADPGLLDWSRYCAVDSGGRLLP